MKIHYQNRGSLYSIEITSEQARTIRPLVDGEVPKPGEICLMHFNTGDLTGDYFYLRGNLLDVRALEHLASIHGSTVSWMAADQTELGFPKK